VRIFTKDHCLILEDVPCPPSDNALYINVRWGKGRPSRIKSPEYRAWCETFGGVTLVYSRVCRDFIVQEATESSIFAVTIELKMPYNRLFTKKGLPRRLDAQNRLKAICDALAKSLEIDDSYFWDVRIFKSVGPENSQDSLHISIKPL
jgi:hypothetical protein